MQTSVVICTLNRSASLAETLDALRAQQGPRFELIVVNGPSSDGTDALVRGHRSRPLLVHCPEPNVSMARNIAIDVAGGDLVAFLDDDCLPGRGWLEALVAGFSDDGVAAVGGPVFQLDGIRPELAHCRSDRIGTITAIGSPPAWHESQPGADPFPYLTGGNMSFRRAVLVDQGGFDETLEYVYDDVDICLRLIDAGCKLHHAPRARVRHKRLPNRARDEFGVMIDPFMVIRNRSRFAFKHGLETRSRESVLVALHSWVLELEKEAMLRHDAGQLAADQLEWFLARVEPAIASVDATERGTSARRGLQRSVELRAAP